MEYGLQLYSVRDLSEKNLGEALFRVAEQGYRFVEFAGFFGHSARVVRAMLDANGLRVSGTHTGGGELTPDRIEETIEYHLELGNRNIIIPWADFSTREHLEETVELCNAAEERLRAAGISLGYHNHSTELMPTAYGANIYEELCARTRVFLEVDTYWVYAAGVDPVALLSRLGDRVPVIHIKDGTADGSGYPLGEGTAPVKAVYDYATAHGIPMVVESETCTPSGLDESARCMRYLRSLEAK